MTRFTKCIVHAGTHKTGTTSVQNVMAAHRTELAAAGFFYPAPNGKDRDHNALAHQLATCTDGELAAMREQLVGSSARVGLRLGSEATLLLSAEEFSTRICHADAWAQFDDGAYWERRLHYLERLRRVLPEAAPVEVFVCFRDHESYAHSLYATKVLSGKLDCSFTEFVQRCAPIFDYRRQVEVLAAGLGPVRVESYERLRSDLANRFFAWLGVPLNIEQSPRLRPTPSLDLIHWLATTQRSPTDEEERRQRAAFCRDHGPQSDVKSAAVHSLWPSQHDRQVFLRQCHAPPLEGWPQLPAGGRITDAGVLARRTEEIETEYRRWRQRYGGHRKHWVYFWRRL